ncbi:vacuolar protein sorting-associated protein 41 [Chloropicon primus]|uniref:Vacuolar protein sorting-associated protein 41 homolog n=2 Tax=Chloropicon primus TaxID=1764295 RepID=A0A5B8MCJ6_9CHLO|nr:vacuolar protein sorting-associated protein 41 [Chloropicon primus]UPQ97417.1 vacuolar protein sorting-associated protein 41 [Chloropicon primus]|eukprot:QDZ18206.1 vacuolar protein sorting-associated protein 41 [Chloropicon primus]
MEEESLPEEYVRESSSSSSVSESTEEENSNSNSSTSETEEEDTEPLLKYQRLGTSVQELLDSDGASCVSVSSKVIAIGTHMGQIFCFDPLGHIEVKKFSSHTATVNEICTDEHCEYLGSCSDDGTVVIVGLYSDEKFKQEYRRPVKTVALDPKYRAKKSRQFVSGGLAGQLVLNTKGWLGNKDYALHSGEGTIHAARWTGSLIAWANDIGVRIYDCVSHQCIKYINRPKGSPRADLFRASLFWQSESLLIVGWADSVTILKISVQETPMGDAYSGGQQQDFYGGRGRSSSASSSNSLPVFRNVQVVASFQTDYYISGIAPFGQNLVALAYVIDQDDNMLKLAEVQDGATYQRRRSTVKGSLRPEVRVITWMNEELASDALTIHGYEHYKANDYLMASYYSVPLSKTDNLYASTSSEGSGGQGEQQQSPKGVDSEQWWVEGDEPMYYIVSPRDIVLARPRGPDDRIQWLLENKKFEEALAVLETSEGKNLKDSTMEQIGYNYLTHLFEVKDFAKAASLCPKLLFQRTALWERWVLEFAKVQQLALLCRYIPVDNPRLRQAVYDMVMKIFLQSDHENFLYLVKSWPAAIYNMKEITDALLAYEARNSASSTLREALAELYILQDRKDLALGIFLQLQRPEVFDFIARHRLLAAVQDKIVLLVQLDSQQAIALLVDHSDQITPDMVVSQLKEEETKAGQKAERGKPNVLKWRMWLHQYLHQLFESSPNTGTQYHAMQIELYAEFAPKLLMNFLTTSNSYPLELAYKICESKGLFDCLVWILARMGNARQALHLIMEKLGDVPQAIEFVRAQRDDELWEELISMSLASPRMVGTLLESIGSHLNPLRLIHRIPLGMPIPNLRDRLIKIITDSRTQASLIQGCNDILKADRVMLLEKLHNDARRAVPRHQQKVVAPQSQYYK